MTDSTDQAVLDQPCFSSLLTNKKLVESLAALEIIVPTPIQAQAIPIALNGQDLIAQAQTGSGKTLAFMLPILSQILEEARMRRTRALIVAPTRELALQVKSVVESLKLGLSPACLIGGASARDQERQLQKDARVIVGTPGRILDFMQQRLINLRECRTVVLDEADEMLSMGFLEDVRAILKRIPPERQGMFFSATITPRVLSLANSFLKDPQRVTVTPVVETELKIDHLYCSVEGDGISKVTALCRLLTMYSGQSAIVFCNTKSDTELVEVCLRRRGFEVAKTNSDLKQSERDRVMAKLRSGELKCLIATDVAARGIDIKDLDMVINYSLPKEAEVYVHRTGRTGRAGASGKAISVISPMDLPMFYNLGRQFGIEMREIELAEATAAA